MSALLKPSGAVSDTMSQQLGQRQAAACKAMNKTSERISRNMELPKELQQRSFFAPGARSQDAVRNTHVCTSLALRWI